MAGVRTGKRTRGKRADAHVPPESLEPPGAGELAAPQGGARPGVPVGAYAACAAVIAAVFARAVPYPLQASWDDARFLTDNSLVMRPSWDALQAILAKPQLEAYHPLHLLSYWLDAPWSGADPRVLHATNLVLWIGAACALLRALSRLGLSWQAALLGTLACAVHPGQVEAVSWGTGRKDVLAMLFTGLALDAHLRAERSGGLTAIGSRTAYVLGVLSKSTVLPLPFVLVVVDVVVRGKQLGRALASQIPSLLFGAGMSAVVIAIWGHNDMIRPSGPDTGNALTRIAASVGHHVATLLWPARVAPMYASGALAHPSWLDYGALLALAALIGSLLSRARTGSRHAALGASGVIAFALLLVPVCNVVPMVFPFQDRYGSLPAAGLALALGAALDALGRRSAFALAAAWVAALGLRSAQYEGAWRDELALWGHATSTQPDAYYAWMKLCEVRRKADALHGAVVACKKLVELEPGRRNGHTALLLTTALRDERIRHLSPSRAERYAATFHRALDDAHALRLLAGEMLQAGYLRTLELPMARALALEPAEDAALEHAAATHFAAGRPSVGLFYLGRMKKPTGRPELLAAQAAAAHAQANAPRIVD